MASTRSGPPVAPTDSLRPASVCESLVGRSKALRVFSRSGLIVCIGLTPLPGAAQAPGPLKLDVLQEACIPGGMCLVGVPPVQDKLGHLAAGKVLVDLRQTQHIEAGRIRLPVRLDAAWLRKIGRAHV